MNDILLTKEESKRGFPCLCCSAANYEDAADKCDGSPVHYGCCADDLNKRYLFFSASNMKIGGLKRECK